MTLDEYEAALEALNKTALAAGLSPQQIGDALGDAAVEVQTPE